MNKKLIDDDHNNYLLSNTYNYKCRDIVLNAMLDNNMSRDQCNLSLVLKQYLYAKNKMTFYKQKVVHFLNGPGCEGQT